MFHPYTTPGFLRSSSSLAPSESLYSAAASTSIYTATSSGTIQPGIGSLSGRFILGFGKKMLRGVETVVISRRLSHIESLCPLSDSNRDLEKVYDDMLELSRPGLYSNRIRKKVLELICEQIRRRHTVYLTRSLERLHSLERVIVTCGILEKAWQTIELSDMAASDAIFPLYRAVLVRLAPQNPDRPIFLYQFSCTLSERFNTTRQLADLEEAILLGREALELMPPTHPERDLALYTLCGNLCRRFDQTHYLPILEEAVFLGHQALELMRPTDPERRSALYQLFGNPSRRFDLTRQLADLAEALLLGREAVEVMRPTDHERGSAFRILSGNISGRIAHARPLTDLDEAVLLGRQGLELMPPSHPERASILNALARGLSRRFDQTGLLPDLAEAVCLHREAQMGRTSGRG